MHESGPVGSAELLESPTVRSWQPRILPPLLVFALASLAYVNTCSNGFVWDDRYILSENQHVTTLETIPNLFVSSDVYAYDMKVYRPLRQVMLTLEYQIFGLSPAGYHLINVVTHGVVAVLVTVLMSVLGFGHRGAFVIGAIYGVHPVNSEVVANITGRTDILCALFFVLGLIAVEVSRNSRLRRWMVVAVVAYLLALASKEMAVTFPAVVILLDLRASAGAVRKLVGRVPLYGTLAVTSGAYLALRTSAIGELGKGSYYWDSFAVTMYSQTAILAKYLRLMVVPYPLSARYDIHLIHSPWNVFTISFLIAAVALAAWTIHEWRQNRFSLPLVGIWWFLITLLPVSNVIPIRAAMMGERYLYIPMIGLLISGVAAVGPIMAKKEKLATAAVGLKVLLFFLLTCQRNVTWKSNLTLFEDTVTKAPDSLVVHWTLFHEYQSRGDNERVKHHYAEMQRINLAAAREKLAIACHHLERGRIDDARRMAEGALVTRPGFEEAEQFLDEVRGD